MDGQCSHVDQIHEVTPSANGCEECLKTGDRWVHLSICVACGHVGCCYSSKNKHATKHFRATEHPLIQSFQPVEDWIWCFLIIKCRGWTDSNWQGESRDLALSGTCQSFCLVPSLRKFQRKTRVYSPA